MRNSIRTLSALVVLCIVGGIANAAESKAVQTMAGILTSLQHVPSAEAKQTLMQIAESSDATAEEKTVAKALANVQHKVAAGDKAGLEAIVNDANASSGAKTLASIILSMNHFPSAADKEKLAMLSK